MRSVRSLVKVASRQAGREVLPIDLLRDPSVLASAACDARRIDGRGDKDLTSDTLGQRRMSVRSCIRLMEDVLEVDADEHVLNFEAELRQRYSRVGQSLVPTSGCGRDQRDS